MTYGKIRGRRTPAQWVAPRGRAGWWPSAPAVGVARGTPAYRSLCHVRRNGKATANHERDAQRPPADGTPIGSGQGTGPAGGETGEEGRRGRPREREDVRPVHRLPCEDGAGLKEGRGGAVRPIQCDGHQDHVVASDASRVELACVRLANGDDGAAATTTDSKARSRPPPRQSVCRP